MFTLWFVEVESCKGALGVTGEGGRVGWGADLLSALGSVAPFLSF